MTSGFVAKLIKQTALVYDIRTSDENDNAVFIIFEAEKSKRKAFLEKMAGDNIINLEDYGTILHQGYGEPDEALKAELKEKYGLYDD
jgi:hypothetical protein